MKHIKLLLIGRARDVVRELKDVTELIYEKDYQAGRIAGILECIEIIELAEREGKQEE